MVQERLLCCSQNRQRGGKPFSSCSVLLSFSSTLLLFLHTPPIGGISRKLCERNISRERVLAREATKVWFSANVELCEQCSVGIKGGSGRVQLQFSSTTQSCRARVRTSMYCDQSKQSKNKINN